MHIRKLVKAGQSSYTVSLPKQWVTKNNLKKGDNVYLVEKSDNELAVLPDAKESKTSPAEITIPIDGKEIETIQREITSAYINNYSTITLIGEQINEKAKELRRLLHDFVALEIAEQTGKRLVAKDLLNLKEISVAKTVNRMDMILRTMLQDSIACLDSAKDDESILFRDYDMNKLYFLMFRLLKGSLKNKGIADSFGLQNEEILSKWYLVLNLENIADHSKALPALFKRLGRETNTAGLKSIYLSVQNLYLDAMKAYNNKDKTIADNVAKQRTKLMKDCALYLSKEHGTAAAEVITNLKSMLTLVMNISRIVIDEDIITADV